jgi:undecaprenyl diphosphate synthase
MGLDFIPQSTYQLNEPAVRLEQRNGGNGARRLHAAIIMDGNGRWAIARGLPRLAGHRAGADAVRRTVEAAPAAGIDILTLYAFSSDNWRRPPTEVTGLMELLDLYLRKETKRCLDNGVRLEVIGRRDRLDPKLVAAIERTEAATAAGVTLTLRVAVDYSSRQAIERGAIGPDVDILIRTGGEQRLSDFLLWECAYAELIFTRRMWPDFDGCDLEAAVKEFHARERRFGGVPEAPRVNGTKHASSWLD